MSRFNQAPALLLTAALAASCAQADSELSPTPAEHAIQAADDKPDYSPITVEYQDGEVLGDDVLNKNQLNDVARAVVRISSKTDEELQTTGVAVAGPNGEQRIVTTISAVDTETNPEDSLVITSKAVHRAKVIDSYRSPEGVVVLELDDRLVPKKYELPISDEPAEHGTFNEVVGYNKDGYFAGSPLWYRVLAVADANSEQGYTLLSGLIDDSASTVEDAQTAFHYFGGNSDGSAIVNANQELVGLGQSGYEAGRFYTPQQLEDLFRVALIGMSPTGAQNLQPTPVFATTSGAVAKAVAESAEQQ